MADDDPLDSENDPFRPPAIPTLVACLHCGQEYESFLIEWRIETNRKGEARGFWCCPIEGCDGRGFGFDILPVDPTYQDEFGGWSQDDEDDDEALLLDEHLDDFFPDPDDEKKAPDDEEEGQIPF